MNTFYEHHENSIRFGYRCFDRILINGLIQPFQQPERVVGFFNTYRARYPVSKAVLTDVATQYQRWVIAPELLHGGHRSSKPQPIAGTNSSSRTSVEPSPIRSWS